MGFQAPTGSQVTIAGALSLPAPASNQTVKVYSNGKSGTAITAGTGITVGTVTAGKTFYCTSISVSQASNNVGTNWNIKDGGVAGTTKASGAVGMSNGWERYSDGPMTFPTPITFSAGNAINLDVSTSSTIVYTVVGYEA